MRILDDLLPLFPKFTLITHNSVESFVLPHWSAPIHQAVDSMCRKTLVRVQNRLERVPADRFHWQWRKEHMHVIWHHYYRVKQVPFAMQ
ncbi:MAG: hypothetical protein AB7G28_14805 [Pirellulales bacterium]